MSKKKIVYNSKNLPKATAQKNRPESYDTLTPSWTFHYAVDSSKRWSLCQDNGESFVDKILPKLQTLERMTWQEIKSSQNHKSHYISVEDICSEAVKELEAMGIYEDSIFSLRLTGENRLWGILSKGVLNIIWYDEKYEIYPYHKKHT